MHVSKRLIDCANPAAGVERPKVKSTVNYLDKAEIGRLLAEAAKLARAADATPETVVGFPMVATALYTGMRKAGRLDVMRSYCTLPKSGKPRHLPLHPELAAILKAWREECPRTDEHVVFPDGRMGTEWGHA